MISLYCILEVFYDKLWHRIRQCGVSMDNFLKQREFLIKLSKICRMANVCKWKRSVEYAHYSTVPSTTLFLSKVKILPLFLFLKLNGSTHTLIILGQYNFCDVFFMQRCSLDLLYNNTQSHTRPHRKTKLRAANMKKELPFRKFPFVIPAYFCTKWTTKQRAHDQAPIKAALHPASLTEIGCGVLAGKTARIHRIAHRIARQQEHVAVAVDRARIRTSTVQARDHLTRLRQNLEL